MILLLPQVIMKELLTTYGLVVGLLAAGTVIEIVFGFFFGKETLFLLFFPIVFVSAWYKGVKPGIIATTAASLIILYFFFPELSSLSAVNAPHLVEIYLFFLQGVVLSVLINKAKHTDVVNYYRTREKIQSEQFLSLEKKYTAAQEEIKARDEFLSIASHELKTPLTSMLLQLQTALHNIQNVSLANFSVEHLLKMLESVQRQTNRLSKMINDLLNVSLMTTRKLELEREEFDISQLTKEVVESFSEKLEKDGYAIRVDAPAPIVGKWDKVRIEQAITNLLSNAIKYGDNKPLDVKVTNSNAAAHIFVTDHGIGIPDSQKEKIFQLFERGGVSERYKGLGVGLYITNQIVKAHKGKIHVKTKENSGTTFTIELPLQPGK